MQVRIVTQGTANEVNDRQRGETVCENMKMTKGDDVITM